MIAYVDTSALRIGLREPGALTDLQSYDALVSDTALGQAARAFGFDVRGI